MIWTGVKLGRACIRQAANPAARGVEKDVPLAAVYAEGLSGTETLGSGLPDPIAIRSGLMRPSELGPIEEKLVLTLLRSTAPIASTLSPFASAGAMILRQGWLPSLPAAFTTRMPLAAAISAARVMVVVWPSMSA